MKCEGVHAKGWQRDVMKRHMEKRVGREVGQGLQVDLGPGDGLEARSLVGVLAGRETA